MTNNKKVKEITAKMADKEIDNLLCAGEDQDYEGDGGIGVINSAFIAAASKRDSLILVPAIDRTTDEKCYALCVAKEYHVGDNKLSGEISQPLAIVFTGPTEDRFKPII